MVDTRTTSADLDDNEESTGVIHDEIDDHPGLATLASGYQYGKIQDPVAGDALVGWWPLSWSNGRDLSGGGNHGTVNGATTGVAGRGGLRAYSFDQNDDWVDIGSPYSISSSDSYTLSAWFYTGSDVTSNQGILEAVNGSAQQIRIAVNNGDFENAHWDGSNANQVETPVSTDTWYQGAVTYDADSDTLTLYLDGSSQGTTSPTQLGQTANDWSIGALDHNDGPSDYYGGVIADVRIYDRALTTNEIQALYDLYSVDVASPPSADDYAAVSYYDFNSANANDQWGSNDGTVNGATHVSDGGPRGDGAYSFDGTDDYIDVGTTSTFDYIVHTGAFTVNVWANISAHKDYNSIIGDSHASSDNGFRIMTDTSGDVWFTFIEDGNVYQFTDGGPITTDAWYMLTIVGDGSDMYGYINGVQEDSVGIGTSTTDPANSLKIGRRPDASSRFFDGDIDDVRIYSRALTPQEVQQLYLFGTLGVDMSEYTVMA